MFLDLENPGEKSNEKSTEKSNEESNVDSDSSTGLSHKDEGADDESGEDKMSDD